MNAREVALAVVRDVAGGRSAHDAFDYRVRKSDLDARDRAFAAELAYGTIKLKRRLDFALRPYVGDRLATLPPAIAEVLRLGTYQIREMGGVEPRAAVHESVSLAKKYGHRGTAGLVNAVLRRLSEAEAPAYATEEFANDDEALAVRYSYPTWMVRRLRDRFGVDRIEAILAGANLSAQTAVRANLLRITPEAMREALAERGLTAEPSPLVREIALLENAATPRLDDPRWDLQSESAAVPVDLLDPQPGETVIELCAGRGNKTVQIAGRMGDQGHVEAVDIDERKAARERERLLEAGITSVAVIHADATLPLAHNPLADRVLLDAPCSGLGIVGRQPEARWRKDAGDAERLAHVQTALIDRAATIVRPGGRLVYAVCSPDPRENEAIVAPLLAGGGFTRVPLPERYAAFATADGDVLIPPGIDRRDGFYIAVLERATT